MTVGCLCFSCLGDCSRLPRHRPPGGRCLGPAKASPSTTGVRASEPRLHHQARLDYSVVLDLGRGPDGRRIRRWHSGYRTKKDAERARTELLARVDQGTYIEPSRLTLAAFLRQQWLPGLAGRVRATTLHSYRTNLERYVLPRIGR